MMKGQIMRRYIYALSGFLAATAISSLPALAGPLNSPTSPLALENIEPSVKTVEINKTDILRLSEPAGTLIVGDPAIADVSIHASDTLFIIGRGYGSTTLTAMNRAGETILDTRIRVTSPQNPDSIRIFSGSGLARMTFSCTPYCQPAPALGDMGDYLNNYRSPAQTDNNQFSGTPVPVSGQVSNVTRNGSATPRLPSR